jgi:diguanylate cyclase (GGDEF)-like protein
VTQTGADAPSRTLPRSGLRLLATVLVAFPVALVPALGSLREVRATWPFWWLVVSAGLAALSLVRAGQRSTGRLRVAWCLLAVVGLGVIYLLVSEGFVPDLPLTMVVRLTTMAVGAVAIVAFPGTGRSPMRWLLLGLDGWLLGGSLFVVLWLTALTPTHLLGYSSAFVLGCSWVLLDFAFASVLIALTRRIPPGERAGGIALSVSMLLMANGDIYQAFFPSVGRGSTSLAVFLGSWAAALLVAGMAPWIDRNPFVRLNDQVDGRRAIRTSFLIACLAIAAAMVAWALGRPSDAMLAFVVITLLLSVVTGQSLLGVENERLVRQVSRQADLFRDRATRDSLTGLPNRGEFTGRVEMALRGERYGQVAVLFVDLDGFKDVNDSFGHAVGDELLVEAATRLSRDVRERDVVARFGGDEFVALLTDCTDEIALEVAERLRHSLSQPYPVAGREVVVSASIGLARPDADDDAESALRNADLALYRAKAGGRDRVAVYEPEMHSSALRRLDGAARLRAALARDRLHLSYQPIVDVRSGEIFSMEALLRFDGSDLPGWAVADAIAAAEESGFIIQIGHWVLDAGVRQLGVWLGAGHRARLSINVSARQLESGELADEVRATLERYAVPASTLTLEITEHQLVRDLDNSTRELTTLRALGVRIALDDFGTGYSSLSYLPRLPLDVLKLDRDLVARVGGSRDTVPAVLRLGRDLGLAVVAEGVETLDQLEWLRAAGCTYGQGYLFARPLDAVAATGLVARGRVTLPGSALVSQGRTSVSDDEIGHVSA